MWPNTVNGGTAHRLTDTSPSFTNSKFHPTATTLTLSGQSSSQAAKWTLDLTGVGFGVTPTLTDYYAMTAAQWICKDFTWTG